jgi:hypothetical protein
MSWREWLWCALGGQIDVDWELFHRNEAQIYKIQVEEAARRYVSF